MHPFYERLIAQSEHPTGEAADIRFRSGGEAIGYVREFMITTWAPGQIATGVIGEPALENGVLTAPVLIPDGDDYQQVQTSTALTACIVQDGPTLPVTDVTLPANLGLHAGDLVSVLLVDRAPFDPAGNRRWIARIVSRNHLVYSFRFGGWKIDRRFES